MPSPATFASPAAGTRIGQTMININSIRMNRIFTKSHACFSTSTVTRVRGRMPSHRTALAGMPRQRTFFTSNLLMRGDGSPPSRNTDDTMTTPSPSPSPSAAAVLAAKRKPRSAGAKNSLRRVAAIAQQSPSPSSPPAAHAEIQDKAERASGAGAGASAPAPPPIKYSARAARLRREASDLHDPVFEDIEDGSNVISAVCLAESFDMERVMSILESQGFTLDPDGSGFESHEVVHARKELYYEGQEATTELGEGGRLREVDLFVFESGTLVGWGLPADDIDQLATSHLVAAAADPFVDLRETETLDFRRDPARDTSAMRGDVVVLGTRNEVAEGDRLATTRAQIAFSSGLARSTKLAVLERSFTDYFESTRRIPEMLAGRGDGSSSSSSQPGQAKAKGAKGTKVLRHLSQKFVLQKTGELLSLRAQLNHYRELTDALPDIFWDTRAELGLESYYEQVGRALDVGVRIKTLNQKMDYAQEIATVLREISSERHGTRLEWIIIVLITVEVVFELRRVYLDWHEDKVKE